MEIIRTYEAGSKEYKRLERAASILTDLSPKGRSYHVEDTYFDFGQNWMWTTITYESGEWGSVQALNPRDFEKILTYDSLEKAIIEIVSDIYWSDKN